MRLFPRRDPVAKKEETISWLLVLCFFLGLGAVGVGLFFVGGHYYPPNSGTVWDTIVWAGLVIGVVSLILAIQAIASALIEWTMGPEKFIAIMVGLGAIAMLYDWWSETD